VPTNAEVPELDILFVGEFDAEASPLGAKGLGELTAVSVAPAIANTVYHATGRRIRDLPITVESCCESYRSGASAGARSNGRPRCSVLHREKGHDQRIYAA
jgi:CO/xanthine dehydrogenase Mo-binding subunit